VDEVEAAAASTFQFMLHGQGEFDVKGQQLRLDRTRAGVVVDYVNASPLAIRQFDGYDPKPGSGSAANIARDFPKQWHVEASTTKPAEKAFVVAVLRPYRAGQAVDGAVRQEGKTLRIPGTKGDVTVAFHQGADFAVVQSSGKTWRLK
jgi:hypothetical protein